MAGWIINTIGIALIIVGGLGLLVIAVGYLSAVRRGPTASLPAAAYPPAQYQVDAGRSTTPLPDEGAVNELFAELSALRASVGEMASELRTVRIQLESINASPADQEEAGKPNTPARRVA